MFDDLSDEIRDCYDRAAHCVQEAAAQADPTVKQGLLHLGRHWLAMARAHRAAATWVPAVRDQWWRATVSSQIDDGLLTNSRAIIAESRRLLATLEQPSVAPTRSHSTDDHAAEVRSVHKQGLSVRIFQKGSVFGWTLTSPANEMLGSGKAQTELKARIDAFRAGMTYIDQSKSRSAHDNIRFH